jgi:hypothetical protein
MGLEKTFHELVFQLRELRERFRELELTVSADKPRTRDAMLIDTFECAVGDLRGWVEEAFEQADRAQQAVNHPPDLDAARRSLGECQDRFRHMEQVFGANFMSYERINELTKFGGERRGEWPSWVTSVKQGVEQCKVPLDAASTALVECWEEMAGRAVATSVSVHTTSIGQKIVGAKPAPAVPSI